jgi:hypothetical protein
MEHTPASQYKLDRTEYKNAAGKGASASQPKVGE